MARHPAPEVPASPTPDVTAQPAVQRRVARTHAASRGAQANAPPDRLTPLGLVGAGRMDREVAELARAQGIAIVWTARRSEGGLEAIPDERLRQAGVVVEFSIPDVAERTLARCLDLGIPVVSGTTGWEERRNAWSERYRARGGALVYGDNFSLGVHVFLRLAEEAARALGRTTDYDPYVQELHHRGKADAPSGTARALVRRVLPHLSAKTRFAVVGEGREPIPGDALSVSVVRAGAIPGTHALSFDGPHDTLTITHQARSRRGFAAGALLAAGWIAGRTGVWSATEMFDLLTTRGESP